MKYIFDYTTWFRQAKEDLASGAGEYVDVKGNFIRILSGAITHMSLGGTYNIISQKLKGDYIGKIGGNEILYAQETEEYFAFKSEIISGKLADELRSFQNRVKDKIGFKYEEC